MIFLLSHLDQQDNMLPCEKFYQTLLVHIASIYPTLWKTGHFFSNGLETEDYSSPEPRLLFRFLGDPPLGDPFGDLPERKRENFSTYTDQFILYSRGT